MAGAFLANQLNPGTDVQAVAENVRAYHRNSCHGLDAYAPGPSRVDWAAQPSPFRRFEGAPSHALPTELARADIPYQGLFDHCTQTPEPLSVAAVSQLLALSFGISGWKCQGDESWAVRCNPSSGNLHPTEAYVLVSGVPGLQDGLFHYDVQRHALELRCQASVSQSGVWIGLSSIPARETWKYGLRAFRYCQLDVGHAIGTVGFAAATLGWRAAPVCVDQNRLADLFGTKRPEYSAEVEPEEPEVLLHVGVERDGSTERPIVTPTCWHGRPSRCSARPLQPWAEVDAVIQVTRGAVKNAEPQATLESGRRPGCEANAVDVIRSRRSARGFTSKSPPTWATLHDVLQARHLQSGPMADLATETQVETLVAIHKVEGLAPGLYAMPRSDGWPQLSRDLCVGPRATDGGDSMRDLWLIKEGDHRAAMRKLACQQGVASEGAATVVMFGNLDAELQHHPSRYRELHREAGLIGHALYLEATARGLGATGIGCFLDVALRELWIRPGSGWWPIYAFGLGHARPDPSVLSR